MVEMLPVVKGVALFDETTSMKACVNVTPGIGCFIAAEWKRCFSRKSVQTPKTKGQRVMDTPLTCCFVVPPRRFERPTPGLGNLCSIP